MKTLTVYTPTYNRAELLKRAYSSLLSQTSDDFLWMIVDDGSSDDTESVVNSFIRDGKIEIDYIKKGNGGKHTATNCALENVSTELIMIALDSDDMLTSDAVETIVTTYGDVSDKYGDICGGMVFMKADVNGKMLVSHRDESLVYESWKDAVSKGSFDGEALLVIRSEYAKEFRYPVIEGERFFTEAYIYLQMTRPLFWSKETVYTAEYLEDGYTANIMDSFTENPISYSMYNDLRSEIYTSFISKMKYAAYYDAFSMLSRRKGFIGKSHSPILCVLSFPVGAGFYLMMRSYKKKKRLQ